MNSFFPFATALIAFMTTFSHASTRRAIFLHEHALSKPNSMDKDQVFEQVSNKGYLPVNQIIISPRYDIVKGAMVDLFQDISISLRALEADPSILFD